MKKQFSKVLMAASMAIVLTINTANAQEVKKEKIAVKPFPNSNTFTIGGGITQVLLGGFNVQVDYTTNRMVFGWSQGFNIILSGNAASKEAREQKLTEKMTTTLGLGIGYRITPYLDIRFEPKLHFWNVYYDGETKNSANKLFSYKTSTIGVGAYYKYYPFKNSASGIRGLVIMPSVRFWPNVYSSLDDNKKVYFNKVTNKNETYKSEIQGVPGTSGLVINATIGFTFGTKKN